MDLLMRWQIWTGCDFAMWPAGDLEHLQRYQDFSESVMQIIALYPGCLEKAALRQEFYIDGD